MLFLLSSAALVAFLLHVGFLLASFARGRFNAQRYFVSHATLWVAGVLIFFMALLYAGDGRSHFLDYFDTGFKKAMILVAVGALSLLAHSIVKYLVLPARNR